MIFRKITCIAAVAFAAFFMVVSVNADFSLSITGTGRDATPTAEGSGDGYTSLRDNVWKSAWLGDFGIGSEVGNPPLASGKQVVDVVTDSNTQIARSAIEKAAQDAAAGIRNTTENGTNSLFDSAFVYPSDQWPANDPWNYTEKYQLESKWIGDAGTVYPNDGLVSNPAGYYAFQADFAIYEAAEYTILGQLLGDNAMISVLLDGNSIPFHYNGDNGADGVSFQGGGNFTIDESIFLGIGEHTMTLILSNYGNEWNTGNPVGLFVEELTLQGKSTTPEPATMLIFAIGLAGAGLAVGKYNRKTGRRQ